MSGAFDFSLSGSENDPLDAKTSDIASGNRCPKKENTETMACCIQQHEHMLIKIKRDIA